MRRGLTLLLTALLSGVAAAQEPSLAARLGAETFAQLQPVLAAARRDSLPVRALENKALEGAAKGYPASRIVPAVQQLARELRSSRALLRAAQDEAPLSAGEIVAAAETRRQGVAANVLTTLRANAPTDRDLEIPFAVLGELVQRGVPADYARDVIAQLLDSNVPAEQFVELPRRVDVALRVGAPPVQALGSALAGLGIPAVPPRPTGPRRP